jgi:DNA helicase-2/ATP-dependent DNA helicase PcrA
LATDQDDLNKDEDAVKLMTVHASKGLEFEHVFIAGMEQDLFPFKHVDDENMSQAEEEEERRLFYVALTRAKKKVYLSYCVIRTVYGAQRVNAPSEFIEDIAKDLIDDVPPEKPSGAKAIFIDF